jgi:hypothetical protein
MFASFDRFELKLTKEQARIGAHVGRCDDDIAYLRTVPAIRRQLDKLDVAKVAEELREYGTWDETELADHEQNLNRILWIACGDIAEAYDEKP